MLLTEEGILKFVKEQDVEIVDFEVIDLIGRWHHLTIPVSLLSKARLTNGAWLDAPVHGLMPTNRRN